MLFYTVDTLFTSFFRYFLSISLVGKVILYTHCVMVRATIEGHFVRKVVKL